MSAQQFQRKPEVVEAIKYDGTNADEIISWSDGGFFEDGDEGDTLWVMESPVPDGILPGDWAVRDSRGEYCGWSGFSFGEQFERIGGDA